MVILVSDGRALEHARTLVTEQLAAIDVACSRFREDSELSRLNARAGRAVKVGPLLLEAVEVALRAAALTDGNVDPTLGVALELCGYDRDFVLLAPPGQAPPSTPRELAGVLAHHRRGWQLVQVDREASTIRVPRGISLDLGATAKAWAADRAAGAVHRATASGVLVSLGGDISTAGAAPDSGWQVRVTEDHRSGPEAPGQTISLRSGGLATSSTTARRWQIAGHGMHHILDPATGAPVRGIWRTASVAAADCTDANIASTAALVRGHRAQRWLLEMGLPARLVNCHGEISTVGSWPQTGEVGAHR